MIMSAVSHASLREATYDELLAQPMHLSKLHLIGSARSFSPDIAFVSPESLRFSMVTGFSEDCFRRFLGSALGKSSHQPVYPAVANTKIPVMDREVMSHVVSSHRFTPLRFRSSIMGCPMNGVVKNVACHDAAKVGQGEYRMAGEIQCAAQQYGQGHAGAERHHQSFLVVWVTMVVAVSDVVNSARQRTVSFPMKYNPVNTVLRKTPSDPARNRCDGSQRPRQLAVKATVDQDRSD